MGRWVVGQRRRTQGYQSLAGARRRDCAAASRASAAARRFFDSAYCYCDARVLSALWGGSVWDAKVTMGRKIGWGNQSILDSELVRARQAAVGRGETCEFMETNYTYDDAVALGSFWQVPVSDAKARIGKLMINGKQKQLSAALKSAKSGKKAGKKGGKR